MSLMIIIGLCGSGKSYYAKELTDYKIYDDFITSFYNGNLLYDLQHGNNVCAIDPRLCNKNTFDKYIAMFQKYTNNITLILFENDLETCNKNVIQRNDGRRGIIETNNYLTLQYNIDNYNNFSRFMKYCYRCQ